MDRCTSDLTDDEWVLVAPLIPPAKRGGEVVVREVVNGIMYVLSTSCQWRALPKDLPPRSTVWAYLDLWSSGGTLGRIHHELQERTFISGDFRDAKALGATSAHF